MIKTKPPRQAPDDIEGQVYAYGRRVRVVQLWRQLERSDRWTYLGRLSPKECGINYLIARFGGGTYRAKLYGEWSRALRREEYLEQVTFRLYGQPSQETLRAIRRMREP
ncbi:MAG: hypothetical protein ACRDHS_10755 [Actinomycetota bacterium]